MCFAQWFFFSKVISEIIAKGRHVCDTIDAQTCFTLADYTSEAIQVLKIVLGT